MIDAHLSCKHFPRLYRQQDAEYPLVSAATQTHPPFSGISAFVVFVRGGEQANSSSRLRVRRVSHPRLKGSGHHEELVGTEGARCPAYYNAWREQTRKGGKREKERKRKERKRKKERKASCDRWSPSQGQLRVVQETARGLLTKYLVSHPVRPLILQSGLEIRESLSFCTL